MTRPAFSVPVIKIAGERGRLFSLSAEEAERAASILYTAKTMMVSRQKIPATRLCALWRVREALYVKNRGKE